MRLADRCLTLAPTLAFWAGLLAVTAVTAGCAQPGDAAARAHAQGPGLAHGEWLVVSVDGQAPTPDARPTLRLGADGAIRGHAGCNNYFGSYAIAGERLATTGLAADLPPREPGVGPLATTRMACAPARMAQEQRFLAALEKVNSFALRDDGTLVLRTGDTPRMEARRP